MRIRVTGNPSDVIEGLEEFLKQNGYSFKKEVYGRVYVFKLGFLKSVKAVVYHDNNVDIYGSRSLLNKFIASICFKSRGLSVSSKETQGIPVVNIFDEIVSDIIEARILAKKIKRAKLDLYIYSLIFFPLSFLSLIFDMIPLATLLLLMYLIALVVPRSILGEKGTEWLYIPVFYWRYKARYRQLVKNICSRYMLLLDKQKGKIEAIFDTSQCRS